jgi:replicative DNA helicase
LGGASRENLEHAHAAESAGEDLRRREASAKLVYCEREGSHLPPGLHIVTGQTGGGKSALVMNLAHAAITAGHPVLYVSLELDAPEIAARLVALESCGGGSGGGGLSWRELALRRGLSPADRELRSKTVAALRDRAACFVALVPEGGLINGDVRREALELWREHGKTPLVIFDYLQAAAVRNAERYLQLREHIAAVTMELRQLSRESPYLEGWHGCPVVVLSLTARSNVKGEGKARGMDGKAPDALRHEDLETLKALPKEAGEVEATAVTAWVMALGEKDTGYAGARALTLRLVKNRIGRAGQWIPFNFYGATGKLEEAPARYSAPLEPQKNEEMGEGRGAAKRSKEGRAPAVSGPPADEEAF